MIDGYQEQTADILIRSTVDVGPEKVRPRYTAAPTDVGISMVLTAVQCVALDAFYSTTLNFGADRFDWKHPRTLAAASVAFRARPGYQALGSALYKTSISIRIWP